MNKNPRERLLELIEELKLPLTSEDATEHLENLSDEEVNELVGLYEDAKKIREEEDKKAKAMDPKKYAELERHYLSELQRIDDEYEARLQKIQEKAAHKRDLQDEKTRSELKNLLYEQQLDYENLDKEQRSIYSHLTSSLTKTGSQ